MRCWQKHLKTQPMRWLRKGGIPESAVIALGLPARVAEERSTEARGVCMCWSLGSALRMMLSPLVRGSVFAEKGPPECFAGLFGLGALRSTNPG